MWTDLLHDTAGRSAHYLQGLPSRPVVPTPEALARLDMFDEPLPDGPTAPKDVLALLDEVGSPATVATAGGRYFGFVIGGSLPAALAANWLAGAWDQNVGLVVMSPVGAKLEEVAMRWLIDILGLPAGSGCAFVTGATMANFTCLAAARHAVLAQVGWDVEAQGLFGAPQVTVIVGEEAHSTLFKALAMLGMGRERVIRVPADGQGRFRVDALPPTSGPTIVCLQAGNVNTGAFDPFHELCQAARYAKAWVHVDGAFGLWAKAGPSRAYLADGVDKADSWATDAHKWLNVPYDSGLAFVRDPQHLRSAMALNAAYLPQREKREPFAYTPEASRRARGVEIWAALRSLGRSGVADLIERTCSYAQRFASGLQAAGYQVLNEVVLNQVLVSFGEPDLTHRVLAAIQQSGELWAGETVWQGHTAVRLSVSSWATTEDDVDRCLDAIIRFAAAERQLTASVGRQAS